MQKNIMLQWTKRYALKSVNVVNAGSKSVRKLQLQYFLKMTQALSRITKPIPGFFVFILMHSSY